MIGTKVKIKNIYEFEYASMARKNQTGSITIHDPTDNSYLIEFIDSSSSWFKEDEFDVIEIQINSIEDAINFLISKGYSVTLTKKD